MKKQKLHAYKKTVSIVNETAISMFEGIGAGKKGFLLESYDKNNGRYSFFGIEPEEIITSKKNSLVIQRKDGTEEILEGNPLERLKEYYDTFEVLKDDGELAMIGGFAGSLGYDFIRYTEEIPDENPDEIGIETVQLMFPKEFITIDHVAETLTAVVLDEESEKGRIRGEEKAAELVKLVREKSKEPKEKQHFVHDGLTLYKELRELNPSPYLYYFQFGDFEIIGSSPEMLVKQTDNKVFTCPIAGTRRRGKDAEEDQLLKDDLLRDEKERAEHVMLVDLARNDMGRIAEFGTVKVTQFMEVQNYSHVMHIVSLVEGKKKGERHPFDLVASFLPAGTLSGAPKIRAMEIIEELETVRRGLYGGATGYLDFNGNMDFCITIRTMIKKGNRIYLQAGAGIVADSVGEAEYQECCNKVMALAKTLVEEENL